MKRTKVKTLLQEVNLVDTPYGDNIFSLEYAAVCDGWIEVAGIEKRIARERQQ